jgi:hypothetical protein
MLISPTVISVLYRDDGNTSGLPLDQLCSGASRGIEAVMTTLIPRR